jgi:phospholipid/cholesterol/gamma-HCH transport system substrate-binding protein
MNQDKSREFWAGVFLLTGLALIAGLIILFGELPDLFKPTYSLTVKFTDASGLLKGSDVYLAGAVIGKVTTDPQYIPDSEKVEVKLKINQNVGIRKDAGYVIGSAGLLGDRFVIVKPVEYKEGQDKAPLVKDGEIIEGQTSTDLTAIMDASKPLIDRANDIATQLDQMITRLNVDVFPSTSTADLKETIEKLRHMVDNGDSMITNANDLLDQAKHGQGILGRLINDKKTGDNFRDLVENLKVHGPIFYHDDTSDTNKSSDDGSSRKKK